MARVRKVRWSVIVAAVLLAGGLIASTGQWSAASAGPATRTTTATPTETTTPHLISPPPTLQRSFESAACLQNLAKRLAELRPASLLTADESRFTIERATPVEQPLIDASSELDATLDELLERSCTTPTAALQANKCVSDLADQTLPTIRSQRITALGYAFTALQAARSSSREQAQAVDTATQRSLASLESSLRARAARCE